MWKSMPLADCTQKKHGSFQANIRVTTIPSLVLLCVGIIAFICKENLGARILCNCDKLRCDQFFIFWLLILGLGRPLGIFPQRPYCDGYMSVYQTVQCKILVHLDRV